MHSKQTRGEFYNGEKRSNQINSKGFSLVELIIVIAIMAVLAGTIAPALIKYLEKSRKTTDMSNATEIEKILVRCFVEGYIDIPEAKRTVGYGAWVMLCNKDKKNAPTPYHNRNFSGVWCGADAGVIVGDVESQGDWNYCTELADLLNEEGININSARSYSRGGDDGWDWIIIQVCYNSEG